MLHGRVPSLVIVLALCALVLLPVARIGAVEEGEHAKTPAMFEKYADAAIWTVVVFLVLLVVLGKYAWKPMLEGLERRERSIHDALAEAKKAREDAEQLRQKHLAELAKAQDQVRAIIDEGRQNAQQISEDMIGKARAESQAERERVRREMEISRDQALQQLTDWAAQLATLISAKALTRQITLDDHLRLVDEALAEMKQTNGKQTART